MPLIEGLRIRLRNHVCIPLTRKIRGKRLKKKSFTIISNNCWGGLVYAAHNLQKQTPTVGMFFFAEDYIKFLKRFEEYVRCPLIFINPLESRWKDMKECSDDKRFGKYPIGLLELSSGEQSESIEIFFLHYHSEQEAKEKWERRCQRINRDKMLVKFNDQNGCTDEHIKVFDSLPFKNKICFSVKKYDECKSVITIKVPKSHSFIRGTYEPFGKTKSIDITKLLNEM